MKPVFSVLLCAAFLAAPAAAQTQPTRLAGGSTGEIPPTDLAISYYRAGANVLLRAEVRNGFGSRFRLYACPILEGAPVDEAMNYLGIAELGPSGFGVLEMPVPWTQKFEGARFRFMAVLGAGGGGVLPGVFTQDISFDPPCEEIDFDDNPDVNFDAPLAGAEIQAQWQNLGITVGAVNNNPLHPDLVLAYDSANPNFEDPDLETPGYGPGNDTALGTLLIIAENDVDSDNDGLVDVPDDEEAGGVMSFDFDPPVRLCSITLVDIDDANGTELRFFNGNVLLETIGVPNQGDNSVQTLNFDVLPVTRLDVALGGSGGVGSLGAHLCPTIVNFDAGTTGVELGLVAGEEVTVLGSLGITVSATNLGGGPNKAILFDSAAPTGMDDDLATPGYGPGNDDANAPSQGLVLIVAENDFDGDFDGIVDDPDDEGLGGVIRMDFEEAIVFESASVLDVDDYENAFFELLDENDQTIAVLNLAPLGDNSLQTVGPAAGLIGGVWAIELHLSGSGAWVDLVYCPENLTGEPGAP